MKKPDKSPAASHMIWFFLLPSLVFVSWAAYKLFTEFRTQKTESSLIEKARQIETGRSDGDRWKAAYALAEELLKESQTGGYANLPTEEKKEILTILARLIDQFKSDSRLKKYLILTSGRLKDMEALSIVKLGLNDVDGDLRFYSAWGYLEILSANPSEIKNEHLIEIRAWLSKDDSALKKIATSFLAQHDVFSLPEIIKLLDDSDKEIRWNAGIALASTGRKEGKPVMLEVLDRQNLRDFGFRSAKDLEQLLRAAKFASVKLNDPDVRAKLSGLKESATGDTPEDLAIKNGLE